MPKEKNPSEKGQQKQEKTEELIFRLKIGLNLLFDLHNVLLSPFCTGFFFDSDFFK